MILLLMVVDRLTVENVAIDVIDGEFGDFRPANVSIEWIFVIRELVGLIMMLNQALWMTNRTLLYWIAQANW